MKAFLSLLLLVVGTPCLANVGITTNSLPNGTVGTAY